MASLNLRAALLCAPLTSGLPLSIFAAGLSAAAAKRDAAGGADYAAWNVGVTRRLAHGITGDHRFQDTNRGRFGPEFGDRLAAPLAKTF